MTRFRLLGRLFLSTILTVSFFCAATPAFAQLVTVTGTIQGAALSTSRILAHSNAMDTPSTPRSTPAKRAILTETPVPTATSTTRSQLLRHSTRRPPTITPTSNATATPTFTTIPTPFCGPDAGHPFLCRGGRYQGKSCTTDADCGSPTPGQTPPMCTRHGHDPACSEQSQCGIDSGHRYRTPLPLGGYKGDTVADAVVGNCSTEDNSGDIRGDPRDTVGARGLAYDPTHGILWAYLTGTSSLRGWSYPATDAYDGLSSFWVGQTSPYNYRWYRAPGDLTITTVPNEPYTFGQNDTIIPYVNAAGDVWVAGGNVRRFPYPVTTDSMPDLMWNIPGAAVAQDASGNVAISRGNIIWLFLAAHIGNSTPDYVIGTTSISNNPSCNDGGLAVSAARLCRPTGLAFTSDGHLVVADSGNNRGLVFAAAGSWATGMSASTPLCQSDLVTASAGHAQNKCNFATDYPTGVACSGMDCVLTDTNNNRVMAFASVTTISGGNATGLYGADNYTTGAGFIFGYPVGVALRSDALFVPDFGSSAIYRFPWPTTYPRSGGKPAAQSWLGYTSGYAGGGSTGMHVSRRGFVLPNYGGMAFNSTGGVFISSTGENRVGYWATAADAWHSKSMTSILFQEDTPDSWRPNRSGVAGSGVHGPRLISVDASDRLWAADHDNQRVIRIDTPTVNDTISATYCSGYGLSATACENPVSARLDSYGHLWIVDQGNRRVVRDDAPFSSATFNRVVGQTSLTTASAAGCTNPTATTLCSPGDVLVDTVNGLVFITDWHSGTEARILVYHPADIDAANGAAAFAVIGAADLNSWSVCHAWDAHDHDAIGRVNICGAGGLAMSAAGALAVANGNCSGVALYNPPFTTGMNMTRSFGVSDPTTWNACDAGYTASQWEASGGVAFEPGTNNMWTMSAGTQVSRVMMNLDPEAPTPTATGTVTPVVPTWTPISTTPPGATYTPTAVFTVTLTPPQTPTATGRRSWPIFY
jgi:NHL repeat